MSEINSSDYCQKELDDHTIVWTNTTSQEIVRIKVDDADFYVTKIVFTILRGLVADLEEKMKELDDTDLYPNEKVESETEGYDRYHIRLSYNANARKHDFITQIGHWLNPPLLSVK